MYDGYEDEETRRQRRNEETAPYNDGGLFDPGRPKADDLPSGIGSPESGYGEGGVDNPAYQNIGAPNRPGYQDLDYWQSQGVGNDQIFDSATGQLRPGWERFDMGYRRTAAPPPPPPRPWRGGENPSDGDNSTKPTFLPPASPAPQASVAQPIAKPPATNLVTKILQDRLNALSQPFDVNQDDTYKKTIQAYELGQERDARRQRRVAAERAAAGGYANSGALDSKIRGIGERQGQNASMFAAQTAADRLKQRDEQLIVAIQLARAVGQDDLANQLEQQRLRLSEELGRGDLALRRDLGYDRLGFDYASLANQANRDAVLAALGIG